MRQLDKLRLIQRVLEKRLRQVDAARQIRRSVRTVQRYCWQVRVKGPRGVIHGLSGRPSNRQLKPGLLQQALELVRKHYSDFGPTLACEKLQERHGIRLGINTLRRGMVKAELWRPRRHRPFHRAWRPRRACVGEMIQVDGSDHDWFEGRGPRCVLITYVDDATSRLMYAEFAKVEDTLTLMRLTGGYLRRFGRPGTVYVDKDSIYKTNRNADMDEQLRDEQPMTQFTRAMTELGIRVLCAHSPQAKGRVERGFKTHQNRLVKELRLAGISGMEEGTRFLWRKYIAGHNARFSVAPARPGNAHRPLLPGHRLDRILSLRSPRTVHNDFTLRYRNCFLQLLEHQPQRVAPGDKVEVEIRLDGTRHLRFKGVYLNYKTIPKRLYRPFLQAQPSRRNQLGGYVPKGVGPIPAKNHPWRRLFLDGPYRVALPSPQGHFTRET